MTDTSVEAHSEHLRHEQEHWNWSADHMRALAILKRAEAHLFQHEAEIATHRAEIARHEESITHGDTHATTPPEGEHKAMGRPHAEAGENHDRFLNAIFALEKLF